MHIVAHVVSGTALLLGGALGAAVLSALTVGMVWAQEEERVIGVEGVIEDVQMTVDERTNLSGRAYRVATLTLVLGTGAPLTVYEDMSHRAAHVDTLQSAYAATGRDRLVFTMEDLVEPGEEGEVERYARLAVGTRVVIRGPYAPVAAQVREQAQPAAIYRIESVEPGEASQPAEKVKGPTAP